ncbi:MAG: MATE family efflux transporter [Butyrivibrio sp.]|nr:MATE family efflux transporter [Butyrivibrio sp.]
MQLDMTKGSPVPIILKFTLPIFLGNLFQQLYNMVDTIIVGRFVGADALSAVGCTGTIMFLVLGFSQGLTTGFTVLTSQCFGAGDMKRVKRSVANGILLSIIVIIFMTIISVISMDSILRLMNTPENIFEDAKIYILTICYGIVASVFYNLFASFLRAVGNSTMPLVFLIISVVLNVVLDLLFIVGLHLGVFGAALATDLAQGISAICSFIYIMSTGNILWPEKGDWKINQIDSAHQLRVGMPMALQFAITASGTMIMQSAINIFGSVAIGAYSAASKLGGLLTQGFPAMGQAMSTYCGQNFGKGDTYRIRKGVRSSVIISTIYSLVSAGLALILLSPVMSLFFNGDDLAAAMPWAKQYIIVCIIFYIPLGYIFIFRNAMQGCGFGFIPMLGGVVELVARLITAVIAINIKSFILAVACDPVAWLAAGIFTAIGYLYIIKQIEKRMPSVKS